MRKPASIQDLGTRLLELEPDHLIQYRLKRDILQQSAAELTHLKSQLDANPWVQQLTHEQHPHGSWGRFHSQDTTATQKIITTEFGVDRGLALGLDTSHPVFCRTVDYLAHLLNGQIPFPDLVERNDRWSTGVQLFSAATLSLLEPNHPFLDEVWELGAEITRRTFIDGEYDPNAEIQAHRKLAGAGALPCRRPFGSVGRARRSRSRGLQTRRLARLGGRHDGHKPRSTA